MSYAKMVAGRRNLGLFWLGGGIAVTAVLVAHAAHAQQRDEDQASDARGRVQARSGAASSAQAGAASSAQPGPVSPVPPGEEVEEYRETIQRFDWDAEVPNIHRSIDNIFKANGWDDESDRYAQYMVRDVASIPPWELAKRIERMSEHVATRYGLTEPQREHLQGRLVMEFGSFIGRNAKTLFKQAREALDHRVSRKPFTPELVAGWMKNMQPLQKDIDATMERLIKEIGSQVGPDAKEVFDRDLAAFRKRDKRVTELMKDWEAGKWKPSDWGLQDDPIQTGKLPPLPEPQPEPPPPPKWLDFDPATWWAYVLDFKRQFRLDPAQSTTAESIHAEVVERAAAYMSSRTEALAKVPVTERGKHEAYAPIRALFAEMCARLDAIPTTGQRPVPPK